MKSLDKRYTLHSSLRVVDRVTFISNNFEKDISSIVLNNLNNAFKAKLKEIYYRDKSILDENITKKYKI